MPLHDADAARLASLAALTSLALGEIDDDRPLASAEEIVRDRLGASEVHIIYGAAGGFRRIGTAAEMDLTAAALWLIQRDLASRAAPHVFDRVGGRVSGFRPPDAPGPAAYLAVLLPMPGSAAEMVVARGPWEDGVPEQALQFLVAAQPTLALMLTRRLGLLRADREQHQLSALMSITQAITHSEDLQQVLTEVARGIAAVASVEYVSIDLTDANGDATMRCVNYDRLLSSDGADRWKRAVARPDPIRRDVVRSRRAMTFADAQNDERLPQSSRTFFSSVLIRSTGVFPMMIAKDAVIGVVSIASNRPLVFDSAECELFEGLAAQAAAAASGIRLYQELAEKSALLEIALEAEREQARRDSLTGVWNHAAIADAVQHEVDRDDAGYFAVAMVDVDGMKAVNDTYGHLAGDAVLKAVADVLSGDGAVVGRYGGDEFLVLLPGAHRARAEAHLERAFEQLRELQIMDDDTGATIAVAVSAGIAQFPDEAAALVDLVRVADEAMYATKSRRALAQGEVARRVEERVTSVIADLVPLLMLPGGLEHKLRLAMRRLSAGTDYDAVDCQIFDTGGDWPIAHAALFHGGHNEPAEAWMRSQPPRHARPIYSIWSKAKRPIIIDDLVDDDRLAESQRELLRAYDLRSAIIVPMLWGSEVIGQLAVAKVTRAAFGPEDAQFVTAVASQVTAIARMATLVEGLQLATERLEGAQDETVLLLAAAAEAHDRTTGLHLHNIRGISEALAGELGYAPAAVHELGLAATLHDIGKISVPDSLLASPTRFDRDDWEMARAWDVMKQHSIWGAEFLKDRAGFELAAQVARWHHERWDGGGYPDGLRADALPEAVTIVTVADAYDAMISDRPYRAGRSAASAVAEIVRCSGSQFNPRVVDALVRLQERGELAIVDHAADRAA